MREIPTSPFPSGGRDPVAEAVSADYGSLFVANEDDNNIAQFVIGSDGKLYAFNTVNTPGIYPLALAANKSNLFVVDTYEPLPICSTADPCPGSIAVYPLTAAAGSTPTKIGAPATNPAISANYWPLTLSGNNSSDVIAPTAVNVLASGAYVYVTAYDTSITPSVGYIFGFSVGSGGVLTPLSGSPYAAGRQPSAIASDASFLRLRDRLRKWRGSGLHGRFRRSDSDDTGTGGTNEFPAGNQPTQSWWTGVPVCLRGQLPGLHRDGLLHQQRNPHSQRRLHDGHGAGSHRHRSLDQPFSLHRQFFRQQRLRLRVEYDRWNSPRFAVFALWSQQSADRGGGYSAQRYRRRGTVDEAALAPAPEIEPVVTPRSWLLQ